jgi:hypothetical protein
VPALAPDASAANTISESRVIREAKRIELGT